MNRRASDLFRNVLKCLNPGLDSSVRSNITSRIIIRNSLLAKIPLFHFRRKTNIFQKCLLNPSKIRISDEDNFLICILDLLNLITPEIFHW